MLNLLYVSSVLCRKGQIFDLKLMIGEDSIAYGIPKKILQNGYLCFVEPF